jgi:hypothetical protein
MYSVYFLRNTSNCFTGKEAVSQFTIEKITMQSVNLSTVTVTIEMRRIFFYHLATTFLPTACVMIIAEVTLFIDESHFEATVMVALTSMLVMYTQYQSVSSTLPSTPYLKMIDIWLLFGLLMPFIVFLIEVSWELRENPNNHSTTTFVRPGSMVDDDPGEKKTSTTDARRKIGQLVVPIGTLLFYVSYIIVAVVLYVT